MILEPQSILHSRYQIENVLGSGGMGAVYRAFDTLYDKPCAVKEFCLSNLPQEPGPVQASAIDSPAGQIRSASISHKKAIDLFKREAKVLATLNHPNLPKVTDYFGLGEDYYLVMTLVEGKDLHKVMEERQWSPVPETTVLVWARQVMDALGYCHGLNLIHRDVKPSNIITSDPEMIYLVDFGVAKFTEPGKNTDSTAQVLTHRYSPPEQYTGQGVMDARVDIYSLGATLYTVLTGQQPLDAVSRLTGTKLPGLRQINPSISLNVEAAIIKALSLEQDKRFINMQEMADALGKGPEKELAPPVLASSKNEDASTIIYNVQQKIKSPPKVASAPPQTLCSAALQILGIERPHSFSLKKAVTKLGRLSEHLDTDIDIDLTPFDLRRIISRHHASIEFSMGYYFLVDDDSHNGTWLNGRKLSPGERNQLADGDTIKFGSLQSHGVQGVVRISR
jgi:serine/threonine protein kinase